MSVRYVIKEGFAGIARTKLAAFTSMFSLFVAVFLIGILFRVGYNAYELAQSLRQQVEVEVFLHELDGQSREEIREVLSGSALVDQVTYLSQEDAAQIFQEEFGFGGESLADLSFLPASFKVTIATDADLDEVEQFVGELREFNGVDEVKFNLALIRMLESRVQTSAMIGGGLGLLILFVSVILVFNTIRLTIYAKRDLIRAMKLVGATNGFIRRPFLVEGVVQGLIAGGSAALLLFGLFTWGLPRYLPQFSEFAWPYGEWYYLIGGVVLLAVVMGWWGSQWASRKFIRDATVYG
ncbi:MAG: ABC transporter permease [Balneolaceae bacterium]